MYTVGDGEFFLMDTFDRFRVPESIDHANAERIHSISKIAKSLGLFNNHSPIRHITPSTATNIETGRIIGERIKKTMISKNSRGFITVTPYPVGCCAWKQENLHTSGSVQTPRQSY